MPYIEGLEEQKAAVTRIKDNLDLIKKMNQSVKILQEYSATETKSKQVFECTFTLKDDSLKKVRVPVIIEDTQFILEAAKKKKEAIVQAVKADLVKHHISLSPQEQALLESNFATEK